MNPAASYQSPSMQPPDDPDLLDVPCCAAGCGNQAVDQNEYDIDLCESHFAEARSWDEADDRNDMDREEYGRYETDNNTG